jgi:hypothetical protein
MIEGRIIRNRVTVKESSSPLNPGAVTEINRLAKIKPNNDIPKRTKNARFVKTLATFHASTLFFLVSYSINMGINVTISEPKRTALI